MSLDKVKATPQPLIPCFAGPIVLNYRFCAPVINLKFPPEVKGSSAVGE